MIKLEYMEDLQKLNDEQLAEHIRTKDPEAYREVMARYQNKLMRYANYLTHNDMEAADIAQNAFIKAFVNLNGFDAKRKFSSWIYRIVHNEAMNVLARRKNELPMLDDVDFESDENIAEDFEQKEIVAKVEKCLRELPLLYSEPLALRYLEEKSYEEISDILRIPTGTVATRLSRAKILMKHVCQKN